MKYLKIYEDFQLDNFEPKGSKGFICVSKDGKWFMKLTREWDTVEDWNNWLRNRKSYIYPMSELKIEHVYKEKSDMLKNWKWDYNSHIEEWQKYNAMSKNEKPKDFVLGTEWIKNFNKRLNVGQVGNKNISDIGLTINDFEWMEVFTGIMPPPTLNI